MSKHYDIAVIGGGASGLFFTALAAKLHKGLKIAVIEKNQRVGKKLMVTGNGRCNLTNIYTDKINYHGSFVPFMDKVLSLCPPQKTLDLFLEMGLVTRTDSVGRVYPKSNQASTVLDVLRFNCEKDNVEFLCDNKVTDIIKSKDFFKITTDKDVITADKVIFASGGAAAPKAGGDKSGYDLLKKLGHSICKLSPALCPVNVKSDYIRSLKGIRVQGKVSLLTEGKETFSEEGEIQFTESALSGICVFNISQYIDNNKNQTLKINLIPEYSFNEIIQMLKNNRDIFGKLEADNLMTGIFHKRISQALLKSADIKLSKTVSEINDKELKSIAAAICGFEFKVSGVGDFSNAQVTKGGVDGKEIDPATMESKKTKGLYIIGEVLDCNGDCGGFNLQFAFATGYLAAIGI